MLSSFPSYFLLSSSSRDLDPLSLSLFHYCRPYIIFSFFLSFSSSSSSCSFPPLLVSPRPHERYPRAFPPLPRFISLFAVVRSLDPFGREQLHAPDHGSSISAANEYARRRRNWYRPGKTKRTTARTFNECNQTERPRKRFVLFLLPSFLPALWRATHLSREFDPCPLKPTCKKSPFVNYLYRVLRILFHRLKLSDVKFFMHFYIRNYLLFFFLKSRICRS